MAQASKRQKITVGAVLKIPVTDKIFTYGRILTHQIAFYDAFTETDFLIKNILNKSVLFILPVNDYAITKGIWLKISKAIPLEESLLSKNLPPMYKQDIANPQKVQLVYADRFEEASISDCLNLEKWAVWTPEAVQNRLKDYFLGLENDYLKVDKQLLKPI